MNWKKKMIYASVCSICGGRQFAPGPSNRLQDGIAPSCSSCSSLERHRIIYNCYTQLPQKLLKQKRCLHFAPDMAVDSKWFGEYETSVYGGKNSLDLQNIPRSDEQYDWVVCNHVLEHVEDDARAMRELMRVTKYSGFVQFAIPSPLRRTKTDDWGYPKKSQHYHYRVYGADFMNRFNGILNEENTLSVIGIDPITGIKDVLFFVSKNPVSLNELRSYFPQNAHTQPVPSHSGLTERTANAPIPNIPIMKISTNEELAYWFNQHNDFVKHREHMRSGHSEADYMSADLKLIQDLAICNFIRNNLHKGAKVLEIGGGLSRILTFFSDSIEGWNLDKFEGAGNGPTSLPGDTQYKVVQNDIGAFDKTLPENYFDMVFSISVVEHINEEDSILKNIVNDIDRILKPGGLNVHCIDCRFPTTRPPNISNRRLALYMIEHYGFSPDIIYSTYKNGKVFTMSGETYNKFWKKHCNNRPHELDGLPFSIFLSTTKDI